MCETHNRRTTRGGFKAGWRHTVKRTLRNKRTAENRLVTHGYSAADDIRFALFGEPVVSSTVKHQNICTLIATIRRCRHAGV